MMRGSSQVTVLYKITSYLLVQCFRASPKQKGQEVGNTSITGGAAELWTQAYVLQSSRTVGFGPSH